MNNAELDKLLKSAPAPDRAPEFWEQFPQRITARLHWQSQRGSARQSTPRKGVLPKRSERGPLSPRVPSCAEIWAVLTNSVASGHGCPRSFRFGQHARRPGAFAWAVGVAAACLVLAFVFAIRQNHNGPGETAWQVAQAEKCYREIESLFPNQVQSIVFDETGSRIVLGEKADVPASTPLYLKICGPRGCQRVVTFSGQQIRVNGETCDVLQDANGNVLLVGKQLIWSSATLTRETGPYRIEARLLEASS